MRVFALNAWRACFCGIALTNQAYSWIGNILINAILSDSVANRPVYTLIYYQLFYLYTVILSLLTWRTYVYILKTGFVVFLWQVYYINYSFSARLLNLYSFCFVFVCSICFTAFENFSAVPRAVCLENVSHKQIERSV